jgi:hypothetical protein
MEMRLFTSSAVLTQNLRGEVKKERAMEIVSKDGQHPTESKGKVFPSHSNVVLITRYENTILFYGF